MSDIYSEFGVSGVLSEPSEGHNIEMASLPVSVRDGDDLITASVSEDKPEGSITVEINADGDTPDESNDEQEVGEDSEGDTYSPDEELTTVGELSDELKAADSLMQTSDSAYEDMKTEAISRGLTQETINVIEQEFMDKGELSPSTYESLAKVGYSKAFIDSYIAGQEAVATRYVQSVVNYAGGQTKWNALISHLKATDENSIKSLETALQSRDLTTVKTIINLAAASHGKKFGKAPERSVANQAKPVSKPSAHKVEGFASRDEMTKAMSDKRYGRDAAYTREVEQKTINSNF